MVPPVVWIQRGQIGQSIKIIDNAKLVHRLFALGTGTFLQ
jgi:hypothetical protein